MFNQQPISMLAQQTPALPGIIELFRQAWSLYKQRFGIMFGIAALSTALNALFIAAKTSDTALDLASNNTGLFFLLAVFFFAILTVGQIWSYAALIYAIKDRQERIGLAESYRRGWSKFLPYCWIVFLSGFIILGGFFLLIIPGLLFAVWFHFAAFILIAENIKGMGALLKSRDYVRGRWAGVFFRLLPVWAIYPILSLIFTYALGALNIPFADKIGTLIPVLVFLPLSLSYTFLLYERLKTTRGETTFTPTGKQKTALILIASFGFILLLAFSFFLVLMKSARNVAKEAQNETILNQLQIGLVLQYDSDGVYPSSLNDLNPAYLPEALEDPSVAQLYQYERLNNGTDYRLCVQLASANDKKCVASW